MPVLSGLSQVSLPYLRWISPKDEPWDIHGLEREAIASLLENSIYSRYSLRMNNCSKLLLFNLIFKDTGEPEFKLDSARFCRVRFCPVCQWRRSLMWKAKTLKILPRLFETYPNARYIYLTLTVRNCEVNQLRETLAKMSNAWLKLTKRKQFKPVLGFIRSTEVTRGINDTAHPHYHCLLMVSSTYFKGDKYVSQAQWTELWKSCLQIDYTPIVDVRAISNKGKKSKRGQDTQEDLVKAIAETLKYSVKPSDVLRGHVPIDRGLPISRETLEKPGFLTGTGAAWFLGIIDQLHKVKGMSTGGIFKDYFRELEAEIGNESDDDMIHVDSKLPELQKDADKQRLIFGWNDEYKKYRQLED